MSELSRREEFIGMATIVVIGFVAMNVVGYLVVSIVGVGPFRENRLLFIAFLVCSFFGARLAAKYIGWPIANWITGADR